jgi:type VI protein secretion system component Hcp
MKLTDIMVTKVHFEGEGDQQALKETVMLSFAQFRMDYKVQNDTGSAGGAKSYQFDVQRQQGSA